MKMLSTVLLLTAGLFNLYSVIGIFGGDALARLYGVRIEDPNLLILMRHRAVFFGLLGGGLLLAAFRPALQPAAIGAGLVSMLSIILLILTGSDYNGLLFRIMWVDSLLTLGLLLALAIHLLESAGLRSRGKQKQFITYIQQTSNRQSTAR